MGEVVNLKRARKARERAAAAAQAAEARVRHGRDKATKRTEAQTAAREKAALDGKRTEPGDA
jgi:hypothetical protein